MFREFMCLSAVGLTVSSVAHIAHKADLQYEKEQSAQVQPIWADYPQELNIVWLSPEMSQTDKRNLRCLAENIYHEARGSNYADQVGVAWVTINRVRYRGHGDVCSVVWEPYQFSWTLDRSLWKIQDRQSWRRAMSIARKVYFGDAEDITRGSTHYFNPSKANPRWQHAGVNKMRIGAHLYMRIPGEFGG